MFVPPILGFVITIFAGWPGGISPDASDTIREGLNFYFSGHQSPLFSLVWAVPLKFLPIPHTVKIVFALQSLCYWLTFTLFAVGGIRNQVPIWGLVAGFAGFIPPLLSFTLMVESNIQVGIAWVLAIATAHTIQRRWSLLICLPLIFYGFIVRHGMITGVVPILLASFLLVRPRFAWKTAAAYSLTTSIAFAALGATITSVFLGNPTTGRILSISHLVDIAGVYQKTGTHCVPSELIPPKTTVEMIMADFDPTLPATIIWRGGENRFLVPDSESNFSGLRDCWLQTIRRYPWEFLAVKSEFALHFLMVGIKWAPAAHADYSDNGSLGLSVPSNPVRSATGYYIEQSRTTLVWKGWFWLILTVFCCVGGLYFKAEDAIAATAIAVGAFGTLIPHFAFGQGVVGRYYFLPYILWVAALLILGAGLMKMIFKAKQRV